MGLRYVPESFVFQDTDSLRHVAFYDGMRSLLCTKDQVMEDGSDPLEIVKEHGVPYIGVLGFALALNHDRTDEHLLRLAKEMCRDSILRWNYGAIEIVHYTNSPAEIAAKGYIVSSWDEDSALSFDQGLYCYNKRHLDNFDANWCTGEYKWVQGNLTCNYFTCVYYNDSYDPRLAKDNPARPEIFIPWEIDRVCWTEYFDGEKVVKVT